MIEADQRQITTNNTYITLMAQDLWSLCQYEVHKKPYEIVIMASNGYRQYSNFKHRKPPNLKTYLAKLIRNLVFFLNVWHTA